MTTTEIIEALRRRLAVPGGRHLYAVLGSYPLLKDFARHLQSATDANGKPFPAPCSINRSLLERFSDDQFLELARNEAKYIETTKGEVQKAFDTFLDTAPHEGLVVLSDLELVFAYGIELGRLRAIASDDYRILLLLPGRRVGPNVELFPEAGANLYTLPPSLIADNQTWELTV